MPVSPVDKVTVVTDAGLYFKEIAMSKTPKKVCRDGAATFLAILLSIVLSTIGASQVRAESDDGVLRTARQRLQTRITYSCVSLPIDTVLMDLAEQAKIDIVKSPKVTGNVTVKVTNVPLEEALTNILAVHDYAYIATESMIRVMPIPEMVAEEGQFVTRIYQITYADAEEVAQALEDFVSKKGKVGLNKGTSHIIVTDTESKIKAIDKFVEQIDHVTSQVLVEVRVYDITSNEGFELGTDWRAGRNAPLTAVTTPLTETTAFSEDRTDTTIIDEAKEGNYESSQLTDGSMTWTGENIVTRDEDSTETKVTKLPTTVYRRKPFVGGSFDRITGGALSFSLLNDAVDIDFMLSILHQQVEAKLLANPRILVLDNEPAEFEIIQQVPYREMRQIAREDPITYTEFKKVGVRLKVKPHIASNGMIRLRIEPELGILVGFNSLGAPIVDTRRVDTTALIRDGQTIVLGGLRQKEITKDVSKVPLLGDIPLVGGLFRSETESVKNRELVVFITTKIITEAVLSETEERQLSATEFVVPEVMQTWLERNKRAKRDKQLKIQVDKPDSHIAEIDEAELEPVRVDEVDIEIVEPETEVPEPDTDIIEITEILDRLLKKTSAEY